MSSGFETMGTRATTKYFNNLDRFNLRGSGGGNFIFDGVGNVHGEDRILDNGVDNNTAVIIRSNQSVKIFVGKGNRDNVQLGDKNICGGVHSNAVGKYFDRIG